MSVMSTRRATPEDAEAVADLLVRAREAAAGAIPPAVHPPAEVLGWVTTVVIPDREVWLVEEAPGAPIAVLVLADDWVDQLYVDPSRTGQGLGSRLLDLAKSRRPDGLQLWTFAANLGAQRFYARHGFVAVEATDGAGNEEQAPDVRFVWPGTDDRVVSAARDVAAGAAEIFELIADPAQQPRWDGNANLSEAAPGQRVRAVGDVFAMTLTAGSVRENHVVELVEQRRIAWRPSEVGRPAPGHLWRWTLEPIDANHTRVTHTYDWTELTDEQRFVRARATTADKLRASLDRLADLAERG
jgi:GNAT superfamily N-acetyltransferase/uncharacterized protein YndB with AHSA1/START domain